MSFEEYLKSKRFTKKSIRSRMLVIDQLLRWMEVERLSEEEVSYNDILVYIKYRSRKGTSQRSIQHYMGIIKHYFDYLVRENKRGDNPVSQVKIKGVKRKVLYHILDAHELQAIHHKYPTTSIKQQRNRVILSLLINQGLKTDELSKLEVQDVDLREGKLYVKGGRKSEGREMKLEAHQVMELHEYLTITRKEIASLPPKRTYQKPQESNRLFIGDGGSDTEISNLLTQLMIQVRKLNPTIINAKHIRACVITKWLRMYNLREVQYLAGHRYISSTERYLENEMEGLIEEVQQFHPLG